MELVTGNIIMCMSGIGNRRCDYERLIEGLKATAAERKLSGEREMRQPEALTERLERTELPKEKIYVPIDKASGKVCAASIIPYPPGVPMLMPGERIGKREILRIREAWRLGLTVEGICEKPGKSNLWIEVVMK